MDIEMDVEERKQKEASLPSSMIEEKFPSNFGCSEVDLEALVEKLEQQWEACLTDLVSPNKIQELALSVLNQDMSKFLALAEELQELFKAIQKQSLSDSPSLKYQRDIRSLEMEIARKDHLLSKYQAKLKDWEAQFAKLREIAHPEHLDGLLLS